MKKYLSGIFSVAMSILRLFWLKIFHGSHLTFSLVEAISPLSTVELDRRAELFLGKRIRARGNCRFLVRSSGHLKIGDHVFFNFGCIIACHDDITIGNGSIFGPNVMIYDHDHDFRAGLSNEEYQCAAVEIGENVWIGANTVILKGTKIGNNCVVGAGSVIGGNFPDNCVIIQKRHTDIICHEQEAH